MYEISRCVAKSYIEMMEVDTMLYDGTIENNLSYIKRHKILSIQHVLDVFCNNDNLGILPLDVKVVKDKNTKLFNILIGFDYMNMFRKFDVTTHQELRKKYTHERKRLFDNLVMHVDYNIEQIDVVPYFKLT